MKKRSPRPSVFVLAMAEEIDRPYAEALARDGRRMAWFPNPEALVAAGREQPPPAAVVVDLDTIEPPFNHLFDRIKTVFPSSELLALSSTDSSRLAMLCLRFGFSDFLLKPISPEQLAWTLDHCCRRHDLVQTWKDPNSRLLRTLLEISASASAALIRIETLKYLREVFQARSVAWLSTSPRPKWLATVPGRTRAPAPKKRAMQWRSGVFRSRRTGRAKLVLVRPRQGTLIAWGMEKKILKHQIRETLAVVEHAELCLRNLKKLESIQQQAFVDDLTSLYNSRYLKHCLGHSIARSRRTHQGFSVLFIDLDRFKGVNDRFGHTVGSGLLVAIARTLKNSLRSKDPVFRYGGDEFVVILQNTALDRAYEVAERLRNTIEKKAFYVRGHVLHVTISVGIAVYPDHAPEPQTLLRMADEAMYSVKKHQRNAVQMALGGALPTPATGPANEAPDSPTVKPISR
jgi:diguanylate cyclase (GGDEF)-like protein